jgi:hypothetical protein
MTFRAWGIATAISIAAVAACSSDIDIGRIQNGAVPATGGTSGSSATGGTSGSGGSAGSAGCNPVSCQGRTYECGNCIDDDRDGTIDAADVHCTGPCDDSEASFAINIFEGTGPACKLDCFFDGDVGSGNDGCAYSHRCDELSKGPDYPPSGDSACAYDENAPIPGMNASCADVRAEQPALCTDVCQPLVPNGCDCFGCCELPAGSGSYVWLGSESTSGCTMDTLTDQTACKPCTPVEVCLNRCDPCEICVGRTTLDASCDGGTPACPEGLDACGGEDGMSCGPGAYCITGCCQPEPH